ncbi:integrase/recombinase xerD homolog [Pleurodeles waltl]|uniref:integrase/recombinase xerD homolog n=1 Tax=Pleurodeles waltl TaxID=8319 RepID=UPI00370964AE
MNSLVPSTRQAYAKAWEEFLGSGARRRERQEEVVEDVIQFIMDLIGKGQSRVTISGKLSALGFMGKLVWGYPPSAGKLRMRILQGWEKSFGQKGLEHQPISLAMLKRLITMLGDLCYDDHEVILFRTLMSWMFFGAFRVSELLGLSEKSGILWREVRAVREGLALWVRQSKTDQKGLGVTVVLRRYPYKDICPVNLGVQLRSKSVVSEGPVFCHADGRKVTAAQLLAILRKGLSGMGFDAERFGTHSFRIGVATEAGGKGWDREEMMALGRWRSDCFRRYVRGGDC